MVIQIPFCMIFGAPGVKDVGKLQFSLIADVAEEFGTGDLRLTIFQNLIIPNIPDDIVSGMALLKAKQMVFEKDLLGKSVASLLKSGPAVQLSAQPAACFEGVWPWSSR